MIQDVDQQIYNYTLKGEELSVHFQPIVSISKRKMIGFESLLRANFNGEPISPQLLFFYSHAINDTKQLDNICRNEAFYQYKKNGLSSILFVNFETTLLEYYRTNLPTILAQFDSINVPRSKVVIEINEKGAESNESLVELSTLLKEAGFLVALDDVGAGHSNLNRIALTQPDIVKIDRMVITDIDKDYFKQEVLRSITSLAIKIGAIVIAEGVETLAEAITCVACGADWFQGYYFSRAIAPELISQVNFMAKCETISMTYRDAAVADLKIHMFETQKRKELFLSLLYSLCNAPPQSWQNQIANFLAITPEIECSYIIDHQGIQITNTIFNDEVKRKNDILFSPMYIGDCHISKPYYYLPMQKREDIYISEMYISSASGNFCQTMSMLQQTADGTYIIVCVDFTQ